MKLIIKVADRHSDAITQVNIMMCEQWSRPLADADPQNFFLFCKT